MLSAMSETSVVIRIQATLWQVGQPRFLLGFLTQDQTVSRNSVAYAVNDTGQVTGYATYSWTKT